MFYQSVVASTIFLAVVSWGAGIKARDANKLNKLRKKGSKLLPLEEVVEDRMLVKLLAIIDNLPHPSVKMWTSLRASATDSTLLPKGPTQKSFLPVLQLRLYNAHITILKTHT